MKHLQFSLASFLLLLTFQLNASDKVQLGISNLEDVAGKIKDLWATELAKPIAIASQNIKECQKMDLQCSVEETQIHLISSSQDFNFKIEAVPGQLFVYSLELPKAVGVANLIIRGKVLGALFDLKFKIEASSISTVKEKEVDDEDIEWLKGSGRFFLEIKNNLFVANSINFPHWKIDNLRIIPTDRLAQFFMSMFGRFADLEQLALGLLNSQIQNYLQDANLHSTFAKTLNNLFAQVPELLSPLRSYGVKATLVPISLSTAQRRVDIVLTPELKPMSEAHSCAAGLQANVYPPNLKELLYKASDENKLAQNEIEVEWPLSFFENALYLMAKYPLLDRAGKPTPPLLCQNGQSPVSVLGKKQTFRYQFVPTKNISLKADEQSNGDGLVLNLWAELEGGSDKYPRISFYHKDRGQKYKTLLVNVEAKLGLSLTSDGLVFELRNVNIKEIIGKVKMSWPLHLMAIHVPTSIIKNTIEDVVSKYIENNIKKVILLSSDFDISQGHSLSISQVKLNAKNIASKLIIK